MLWDRGVHSAGLGSGWHLHVGLGLGPPWGEVDLGAALGGLGASWFKVRASGGAARPLAVP